MIFWLAAGGMALIAFATLAVPLLRRRGAPSSDRRRQNIEIYRHRLLELESDVSAGVIAAEEVGGARDELLRRLPRDIERDEPARSPQGRWLGRRRWLAAMLLAMLPLAGAALYLAGGGQQRLQSARETPELEKLGRQLAQQMQAHPQDPGGWFLLGRVRMTLGHYAQAADAFARANAHSASPRPRLLDAQAQALGMAADGDFRGKPRRLFEQALAIDPSDQEALWYAGVAAQQAQQPALALSYWKRIQADQLPRRFRPVLVRHMAAARQAALVQPSASGFSLPVKVSLSPKVRRAVKPGATVFIYARAVHGPARPLAVAKRRVADLPLEIRLTDAMRMAGGPLLSSRRRWVVEARVSSTGNAMPSAGDYYAKRTVERDKLHGPVQLVINRRAP